MQELTQFLLDQLNQQLTEKTYICLRLVNAQFLSDKEVEMLQDTEYWQDLSQQLKDVSYLVKVNLISQKQLLIKEQDRPAFVKAEQELLTGEALTEVGQDLGKKSAVLAEQLQDKQFQQEVFDLTHSKLQRYLRGLTDETNAD
jgi:ribonucleotide reductase beta subunit family protein with ferritin-like domain